MSAAENQSPNKPSQPTEQPSTNAPQRPSLMKPPARPARPAEPETPAPPPVPEASSAPRSKVPLESSAKVETQEPEAQQPPTTPLAHPIAPPSEPMQYRAIGLVRGTYTPTEDQFNRGMLITDDGTEVDSVLLGRVTSLVKKHIDLEASHLWVVYPRTRQAESENEDEPDEASADLHLQIVGVWEPETLGMPGENPHEQEPEADDTEAAVETPSEPDSDAAIADESQPLDNYFSIRGEVLKYDEDTHQILVKILQGARQPDKMPKAFRLHLTGEISGKTVGYFWEFDVERQGKQLTVTDGKSIKIVPPKKTKHKRKPFGGKGKRPMNRGNHKPSSAPQPNKGKPRIRPSAPVKSNPL